MGRHCSSRLCWHYQLVDHKSCSRFHNDRSYTESLSWSGYLNRNCAAEELTTEQHALRSAYLLLPYNSWPSRQRSMLDPSEF